MCTIGVRHVQVMLLFSNAAVLYLNRLHLAVTILAMTKQNENKFKFETFDWNRTQISFIFSSFYWGYLIAQMPAAFLVRRYNAKSTLLISTLLTGLLTLLIPFGVTLGGWKMFCVLRALQGLFQGCHYPAYQQHFVKWSPFDERTLLSGLCTAGYCFGMVLAMFLGGMISASPIGWPGTFYVSAGASFIWCLLWLLFSSNDYTTSKFISPAERSYIETSLQHSVDFSSTRRLSTPWLKIFSSPPFWALLIVRSTTSFGFFALLYYLPSYMNSVFKVALHDNALYSTLPYLLQLFSAYIFTMLGNWLLKRQIFSLTTVRKLFNSFGIWLPAACIIWIAFLDEHQKVLAIVLFSILMAAFTAVSIGHIANGTDIGPNHIANTISLMNTVANVAIMLAPVYVGLIVKVEKNFDQWRLLFTTLAFVMCAGDIVFLIWGTADEQLWNSEVVVKEKEVHLEESSQHDDKIGMEKFAGHANAGFLKEL